MASNEDTNTAAPAAAPAAPAGDDPRQFQNPHPDDIGGGGKGKTKAKKDPSGKAVDGSHCCYHCGTAGAKSCCGGCHCAWYCGRACQKEDWRRHKKACRAAQRAEKRRTAWRAAAKAARRQGGKAKGSRGGRGGGASNETCVICIGPLVAPVLLPCRHAYCSPCLAELRAREVAQTCPLCRTDLPEGLDGLYELSVRPVMRVFHMVARGEVSWKSLPVPEQEEMDEALAMLTEAGVQGHVHANGDLGYVLRKMCGDLVGAKAAFCAAIAADPGYAHAHHNLGTMLLNDLKDVEGAEEAFRSAIAADPKHVEALNNLGTLLITQRNDLDGAEAAFRAVVALDPGNMMANNNVANVLSARAVAVIRRDPAVAAAIYEKVAAHLTIAYGARDERVREVKRLAAGLRSEV